MDNTQIPQPQQQKHRRSYGRKILLLGLQCALLMVGALAIWLVTDVRDNRNYQVAREIGEEWGLPVRITGPVAVQYADDDTFTQPRIFNCKVDVKTKSLHRNIYEAEVYEADVEMNGYFVKKDLCHVYDNIYLKVYLPTDQLISIPELRIGDETQEWVVKNGYIYTRINISKMPQEIEYATTISLRGSQGIFIDQIGEESVVSIDGKAKNPSFYGGRLPENRQLNDSTFKVQWVNRCNTAISSNSDEIPYAEARFLVGVDRYQKVTRTIKYAFIIILLTYISVLFTEVIKKRDIPLLNYFLIGAALILFYSLLLAFSEHISFGMSYLIASAMTIALIVGYMWKMIDSRGVALTIGAILAVIYATCYILLSLSKYALLLGSLILFIALAAMMYCSIKVKR